MKRKILTLAVLLGISTVASLAPPAGAAIPCIPGCGGQPGTTVCYCPLDSDNPGWSTTCRYYKTVC